MRPLDEGSLPCSQGLKAETGDNFCEVEREYLKLSTYISAVEYAISAIMSKNVFYDP